MKPTFVLSLFLVLPAHSMNTDTSSQVDSEKGIPKLYKENLSFPISKEPMLKPTNDRRKKIIATALITLLTSAGVASNVFSTYNAFEPVTHQVFPHTDQLPANNATCSYQESFAENHRREAFLSIGYTFHEIKTRNCYANQAEIAEEYCECKNPPCKIILETCQDKDPVKNRIFNASIGAIVVQLGAWFASIRNMWHIN